MGVELAVSTAFSVCQRCAVDGSAVGHCLPSLLSTHRVKQAGLRKAAAPTGAVTLIQRFGSALNLNVHFHLLFLDSVYAEDTRGAMGCHRVRAPAQEELLRLTHSLKSTHSLNQRVCPVP